MVPAKVAVASTLIEQTVDKLQIDAAFLRLRARDQPSQQDVQVLQEASEKISRLSKRLARLARV
jgi:hypothetical protein